MPWTRMAYFAASRRAEMITPWPNNRTPLDAATTLLLPSQHQRRRASERGR